MDILVWIVSVSHCCCGSYIFTPIHKYTPKRAKRTSPNKLNWEEPVNSPMATTPRTIGTQLKRAPKRPLKTLMAWKSLQAATAICT